MNYLLNLFYSGYNLHFIVSSQKKLTVFKKYDKLVLKWGGSMEIAQYLYKQKDGGYSDEPLKVNNAGYYKDAGNVMHIDNEYYELANYYSDKTVAENYTRADKLMRQLRRFSVEHRGNGVNFNDMNTKKFCIYYDYRNNELEPDFLFSEKAFGAIYFDSEETAQAAIDEFHDELIWYFTEYKDSL